MIKISDLKETNKFFNLERAHKIKLSSELKKLKKLLEVFLADCTFNKHEADRYLKFIKENCLLADLTPVGDRLLQWHAMIIELYAGLKRKSDGARAIRELPIIVGRGQAKTRLASWIATAELIIGKEPVETKLVSATLAQANLTYKGFRQQFGERNKLLNFVFRNGGITINKWETKISENSKLSTAGSELAIVSNNPYTLDGFGGSGSSFLLICDEFAAFRMGANDPIETLREGGELKTKNSCIIFITTNNMVRGDIFDRYNKRWIDILEQKQPANGCLPFIFKADSVEDIKLDKIEHWTKSLPALKELGQTEVIATAIQEAETSIEQKAHVYAKYFNLPVASISSYFSLEESQGGKESPPITEEKQPCVIGADLSITGDLTAFCALTFVENTAFARWLYIVPQSIFNNDQITDGLKTRLKVHEVKNELTVLDVERLNKSVVYNAFTDWIERENLDPKVIAYDPWQKQELAGFFSEVETQICDTWKVNQTTRTLSPAMKQVKSMLATGELKFKNELSEFCIANVQSKVDANGNVFPRKERPDDKIDGALALIDCIACLQSDESGKIAEEIKATRQIIGENTSKSIDWTKIN